MHYMYARYFRRIYLKCIALIKQVCYNTDNKKNKNKGMKKQMKNEAVLEEKTELSKEEQELLKKKKNNIKLYSLYRIFSWDLLFYYAIIYLFLTIEKKISPAQALQFEGFYILFKFLLQIPCTLFIQKIGKRKSLIIANAVMAMHILFIMFAPNFEMLLLSQMLCAFSFNIKGTCESDMLYDSLEHGEKRGSNFAKIDGRAMSRYYYVDAISSVLSGFLFVVNSYIPMILCFIVLFTTFILSTKFEDIHEGKGKMHIREELKNIKYGFKDIFKSKRLKSLLLFNALFVGLIKILQNLRNTTLIEIGMPKQYFGIIFAIMGIVSGISARFQGNIHKKYRNRTLSFMSIPVALSCMLLGTVILSNFSEGITVFLILTLFTIQYVMKGPYYVLIKRYFNNFTDSDKRIKISTANSLCENAIAATLIFGASYILEFISIEYTTIIIGCLFTMGFVLLLDYMRKTVGLKPEEYSKKEIL